MVNKLSTSKRTQIVAALVEGMSIRTTCRLTSAAKGTVLRLLADLGYACWEYQDLTLRNLPCKQIQCDEIWSFCYAKAKNVSEGKEKNDEFGYGDVWMWTAICADTKLIPSFVIGPRNADIALAFMKDLSERAAGRVQVTTDEFTAYPHAVEDAFGSDGVDYAMLVKVYGDVPPGAARYSSLGRRREKHLGDPDSRHASTSLVERQSLTMRMSMRRSTHRTNAFSKKIENLEHAVALHFMHYSFARIHQTLRVTPAMAAGVSDHVWSIAEIVGLLEKREAELT